MPDGAPVDGATARSGKFVRNPHLRGQRVDARALRLLHRGDALLLELDEVPPRLDDALSRLLDRL